MVVLPSDAVSDAVLTSAAASVTVTATAGAAAGVASLPLRSDGFQVRRRSALPTTKTDEKPMAAAPIMGLSVMPQGTSTPAATGMQMEL